MVLVKNRGEYERHALMYIDQHTNIKIRGPEDLDRHLVYNPYTYPCLVGFYTTTKGETEYVSVIECNRKIAKSIVYPHTNKCNDNNRWFKLRSADNYYPTVKQIEAKYMCQHISHVNLFEMKLASSKNEPFLIGYTICHDGRLLKIFLLKKKEAKELIYYKKDRERLKKKNTEIWKKNLAKTAAEELNKVERLVKTYREEDDTPC